MGFKLVEIPKFRIYVVTGFKATISIFGISDKDFVSPFCKTMHEALNELEKLHAKSQASNEKTSVYVFAHEYGRPETEYYFCASADSPNVQQAGEIFSSPNLSRFEQN